MRYEDKLYFSMDYAAYGFSQYYRLRSTIVELLSSMHKMILQTLPHKFENIYASDRLHLQSHSGKGHTKRF